MRKKEAIELSERLSILPIMGGEADRAKLVAELCDILIQAGATPAAATKVSWDIPLALSLYVGEKFLNNQPNPDHCDLVLARLSELKSLLDGFPLGISLSIWMKAFREGGTDLATFEKNLDQMSIVVRSIKDCAPRRRRGRPRGSHALALYNRLRELWKSAVGAQPGRPIRVDKTETLWGAFWRVSSNAAGIELDAEGLERESQRLRNPAGNNT